MDSSSEILIITHYFQVQRSDQGQVSEKQRTYSRGWLDKSVLGKMVSDCGLEMKVTGVNRWTATRGEGQTNLVFDRVDPANILHEIQACQQDMENRPNLNLYKYGYLENGKLLTVEKLEMFCPNVGLTTLTLNQSSFEIDETDCFVWVQKVQNLHTGLICIITVRQTRR